MRKRYLRHLSLWGIAAIVWRVLEALAIVGGAMSLAEIVVPAGANLAPIIIEIAVLLVATIVLGTISWTVFEGGYAAVWFVRDRRNDGPARRRLQACLADINDCLWSIEAAGFPANLIIHSDLYAKLTNLAERLASLEIACPPVDRVDAATVNWHIHLKELAVHAKHGNVRAARRHRPIGANETPSEEAPKSP